MRQSSSGDGVKGVASYKWSLIALAILLGSLLMSRGGFAVLGSLGRFVLPFAMIFLVFKWAKKKFLTAAQDALRKQMEMQGMRWPGGPGPTGGGYGAGQAGDSRRGSGDGRTIDLCPKCGSYLAPGHSCRR